MARNVPSTMRLKRSSPEIAVPTSEWRENMRDIGLMLSGVYQDIRGDMADNVSGFTKWLTARLRRAFAQRAG